LAELADPTPPVAAIVQAHKEESREPIKFHTGEKLTVDEASLLTIDRPVRVVLCVGPQDAGKTTFIARIGELFRVGASRRLRFAWSKTLCAFERATWLATIASGAGKPDTPRTHRPENDTFLHLCIYLDEQPAAKSEILISDLAGETFPTALASREFCGQQRALARADHIVVFLDCHSIIDSGKRHSERDNALTFLRRVTAVRTDLAPIHLHIILSRWDYVTRSDQREAHESFCDAIEADVTARAGNRFATLRFHRIAARPAGMPPTDDVVRALLEAWIDSEATVPVPPIPRCRRPARDFSAFGIP
jgi:hypothetical protein